MPNKLLQKAGLGHYADVKTKSTNNNPIKLDAKVNKEVNKLFSLALRGEILAVVYISYQ